MKKLFLLLALTLSFTAQSQIDTLDFPDYVFQKDTAIQSGKKTRTEYMLIFSYKGDQLNQHDQMKEVYNECLRVLSMYDHPIDAVSIAEETINIEHFGIDSEFVHLGILSGHFYSYRKWVVDDFDGYETIVGLYMDHREVALEVYEYKK